MAGQWGESSVKRSRSVGTSNGATLVQGQQIWVLADEASERSLGPALALADREGAREVHLLVEAHAGDLARRAAEFRGPPRVWEVSGRDVAPAQPVALRPEPPLPSGVGRLADAIRLAGAEALVEGGVLRALVLGLEVARVTVDEGGPRLEIGVGRHDREAHRTVSTDSLAALPQVVDQVRRHRRAGVPPHPANQLAQERWLRSVVTAQPGLVGASWLAPSGGSSHQLGVRSPAPASGVDGDGEEVVVVCSTGVDPDLVPTAADVRLSGGRSDRRLVLVVPEGDDLPVTRRLAASLNIPAQVRTVARHWRELG